MSDFCVGSVKFGNYLIFINRIQKDYFKKSLRYWNTGMLLHERNGSSPPQIQCLPTELGVFFYPYTVRQSRPNPL